MSAGEVFAPDHYSVVPLSGSFSCAPVLLAVVDVPFVVDPCGTFAAVDRTVESDAWCDELCVERVNE